jgi:hypothetical protein
MIGLGAGVLGIKVAAPEEVCLSAVFAFAAALLLFKRGLLLNFFFEQEPLFWQELLF